MKNLALLLMLCAVAAMPIAFPSVVEAATRLRISQPGPDVRVKIKHARRSEIAVQTNGATAIWTGRRYAETCGF